MHISYQVIGRNMKKARFRAGITQERAAELLDISAQHYGRIERGHRPASLSQLAQFAEILNTSIEALLAGSTDCLWSSEKHTSDFGTVISFLAIGCSCEARNLMLDICQTIARHDKEMSH